MKTSESFTKIAAALLKAQRNIGAAQKGADNPFFKSTYADLATVMEACKEHLNDAGILVLQPVVSDETGEYVETVLLHESGEFVSSRMKLVLAKQDMQAFGSAVSYARRYGLQSLVFIPSIDDDGEATMNRNAPSYPAKATGSGFVKPTAAVKVAKVETLTNAVISASGEITAAANPPGPNPTGFTADTKTKVSPFTRAGAKAASLNGANKNGVTQ